jgi:SNF2 family DNA or RNA helicase
MEVTSPLKNDNAPLLPMPIKATPYAHQVAAFNFVCNKFGLLPDAAYSSCGCGAALLMEMGTGKTLTTIAVEGALFKTGRIRRVLVVSPLTVTGVWQEEHDAYADFDYNLAVLKGSGTKKLDILRHMAGQALQVVVINYESAWRLENELAAWKPDLIAADEGHKIKTHNISASKAMHRLGAAAKYRLLLTGTPVTNKAIDVFSQYKFLDPRIFGQSFYAFRNTFFFMTGYGNHTPVLKKSMEDELTCRMHSIAFRATKAECLDLPSTTDIVRKVELEPRAMKLYQSLVRESYAELTGGEVTITNVLTKLLRLSQLTGGFIGSDERSAAEQVSTAKLEVLEDIIDSAVEAGKQLDVIPRFVAELDAICQMLEKKRVNYSLIKGDVKDRHEQVAKFQNDPDVPIFVGQIATAGLGITLTAASTMLFYSLDYSMSNFEQCKARIHRAGQRMPCTYIYLTAADTVDEKVLKALKSKADLAKTLVDDYRYGNNPFM